MTFSQEDVSITGDASPTNWRSFQVVFLAALVGMDTASKIDILSGLVKKLEPGTLIVARSARGMRAVLYPVRRKLHAIVFLFRSLTCCAQKVLELSDEFDRIGLEILSVVHPWTKVVNSVVVLRVR